MTPKFIEHIHLDIPKDFTPKVDEVGDMISNTVNQIWIKQAERIDDELCKQIHDIAVANGIDEIYVLDKKNILSALEKQIPKKATEETINRGIDISGEYDIDFNLCCPNCGGIIGTFEAGENEYYFKYCPDCGQALDWSDTE